MKKSKVTWEQVYDKMNLENAFREALRVCKNKKAVKAAWEKHDEIIEEIQNALKEETYKLSLLYSFKVYEPKERDIHAPKLYPDKIIDHAVLRVVKWELLDRIPYCSYGSLQYRGLHRLANKLSVAVGRHQNWYYLKTDFRHFYESIDHEKMKEIVRKIFKDKRIIRYFEKLIDRNKKGLAIGVGSSQYLANLFLSICDHYFKEVLGIKLYFRYMDDIIMFVSTKEEAQKLLKELQQFADEYKLTIKNNVRIAPVKCGVKMVGCKFTKDKMTLQRHLYLRIRRKAAMLNKKGVDDNTFKQQMASYLGWLQLTRSVGLWQSIKGDRNIKLFKKMQYQSLAEKKGYDNWLGVPTDKRVSITDVVGKLIAIKQFEIVSIKGEEKIVVRFSYLENDSESEDHVFITASSVLKDRLVRDNEYLPFATTILNKQKYYYYN